MTKRAAPVGEKVDGKADRGGSEDPVGPYDLGLRTGGAVGRGFARERTFIEKPEAGHAGAPGHGDDHLTRNRMAAVGPLKHIHSDVDEGHERAAARRLELAALVKSVKAAENEIAQMKETEVLLPSLLALGHHGAWPYAFDHALSNVDLRQVIEHVRLRSAEQAVEVRGLDAIRVEEHEVEEAEVRELLGDVRTAAAEADEANAAAANNLLGMAAEEGLT